MDTLEQQARDLLERMEVPNAQSMTAGELVELANLMGARNAALEEAAKVCDYIEKATWEEYRHGTGPGRGSPRLDGMADATAAAALRIRALKRE